MNKYCADIEFKWWSKDKRLGAGYCTLKKASFFGCMPHCHPQYAFIFCLAGSNEFICDGQHYVQNPGDLIVHNSGEIHQSLYAPHRYSKTVTLYVDPIFLLQLTQGCSLTLRTPGQTPVFLSKYTHVTLVDLAQELLYELHWNKLGREMLLHSLVVHMLVHLLRDILTPTMVRSSANESPRLHTREFSEVLQYMEGRPFCDFSLAELCRSLGTSQPRIIRLFRNCTGLTPNAYFSRVLIKKAQMLLQHDKCTVKEAAFELGFRHVSYFCQLFHSLVGTSPNAFKELQQVPVSIAESRSLPIPFLDFANPSQISPEKIA